MAEKATEAAGKEKKLKDPPSNADPLKKLKELAEVATTEWHERQAARLGRASIKEPNEQTAAVTSPNLLGSEMEGKPRLMPSSLYAYIRDTVGAVELHFLTAKTLSKSDVNIKKGLTVYEEIPFNQEELDAFEKKEKVEGRFILSPYLITVEGGIKKWYHTGNGYYNFKIDKFDEKSGLYSAGCHILVWFFRDMEYRMTFVIHRDD